MDEAERREEARKLIELSDFVDFAPFGQGVGQAWIERAERSVGVEFPPSYRWWLENFGGGEIAGQEIYSVYEADEVAGGGDIAYMRKVNLRGAQAAADKLFICQPGTDEEYYFSLGERSSSGEFPVYVRDMANQREMRYAEDFLDFLDKRIRANS